MPLVGSFAENRKQHVAVNADPEIYGGTLANLALKNTDSAKEYDVRSVPNDVWRRGKAPQLRSVFCSSLPFRIDISNTAFGPAGIPYKNHDDCDFSTLLIRHPITDLVFQSRSIVGDLAQFPSHVPPLATCQRWIVTASSISLS